MYRIGHRGLRGIAPENTIFSFKKAIEHNLDMVELDILMTKDNKIVVFHDYDLKRIFNIDKNISDCTYEELLNLDFSNYFGQEYKEEKIPSLKEVINLLKDKMMINIEIKIIKDNYDLFCSELIKILKEENFEDKVIISSFNHQLIKFIKEKYPNLKTAILLASMPINPVNLIREAKADGIHPINYAITKELIKEVKEAGYFINTWTVNSKEELEILKKQGVDGVVSDFPIF